MISIDNLSIVGMRKAHLRQLVSYIRHRDIDEWYYGNKGQFEKRHSDLLEFANMIEEIADDVDVCIKK